MSSPGGLEHPNSNSPPSEASEITIANFLSVPSPLKNIDDLVQFLTATQPPGKDGGPKQKKKNRNLTFLPWMLMEGVVSSKHVGVGSVVADLVSTPDHLEKIRKFKQLWNNDLQKVLERGDYRLVYPLSVYRFLANSN